MRTTETVSISFEKEVFQWLEEARGIIPRSMFVNKLLKTKKQEAVQEKKIPIGRQK